MDMTEEGAEMEGAPQDEGALANLLKHVMSGGGLHMDPSNHEAIVSGLDEAIASTKHGHLTVNQVLIQAITHLKPEEEPTELEVHGIKYLLAWRKDNSIALGSPDWEGDKKEVVFSNMDDAIEKVHHMEFHELVQQEDSLPVHISPAVVEKAYLLISKLHMLVQRGLPISVPRSTVDKIVGAFMAPGMTAA